LDKLQDIAMYTKSNIAFFTEHFGINGKVVTADAMHCRAREAMRIAEFIQIEIYYSSDSSVRHR